MINAVSGQWRVLRALMVRDLIARYGRDNIGFLWAILEPMILCACVAAMWFFIKNSYEHGVHLVTFIITGYMPLTLFRHMTGPFANILRNNLGVLQHRQITLIDIFFSRSLLEFASATLALCAIFGVLRIFGAVEPIYDIRLAVGGWLLLAWFCLGYGAIIAALTEVAESAKHFIGPMQYMSVPLSPTFYMLDWMPSIVQNLMYFNPLSHPYEMIRAGFFGPSVNAIYSPEVTFIWGCVNLTIGLYVIDAVKEKLHEH